MVTRKKITDEDLAEAVKNSFSKMGVLRYLGLKEAGGSHAHFSRRISNLNLDISHFTGARWNRGKIFYNLRKSADAILVLRTEDRRRSHPYLLLRALLESNVKHECAKCGQLPEWMGNPLTLDVDHINGNWLDDRIENLRFLCPNCHSQFSRNLIK